MESGLWAYWVTGALYTVWRQEFSPHRNPTRGFFNELIIRTMTTLFWPLSILDDILNERE